MSTTHSRATRIVARLSEIWAELDYAQRRLLQIRTGVPRLTPNDRPSGASVRELEARYALKDYE